MLNSSTTSWGAIAAPSALALYLPDTWETMTNRLGLTLYYENGCMRHRDGII